MRFITNGDFVFPFTTSFLQAQQFYTWSYQNGAANPDGIIRLISRSPELFAFAVFGNLFTSYFFLISSLAISFLAFYHFARSFLNVRTRSALLIASLAFTFNPVNLGNLSKVGLILAAAMLPLCLLAVKATFEKQKLAYLLWWVLCLNISFIHPFTLAVNLTVSLAYFAYKAIKHRGFVVASLPKLLLVGVFALLLNAYFLLPLVSFGSTDKSVLTSDVSTSPTDYGSLIDVANTGSIFTGLSLSKDVLKDYDFYNDAYRPVYFAAVFLFYALLVIVFLITAKSTVRRSDTLLAMFLLAFLILTALVTVRFFEVDRLLKLLVALPGGWLLRSPLKWQLYMPFTLAGITAILLTRLQGKTLRVTMHSLLVACLILMNTYVAGDVIKLLLVPRSVTYFGALEKLNLEQKNLLLVNSPQCFNYSASNPKIVGELKQVLVSKNVQVKQVAASDLGTINLSTYDFIMGCQGNMQSFLAANYDFKSRDNFGGEAFQLYQNNQAEPYIYANASPFVLPTTDLLQNDQSFVKGVANRRLDSVVGGDAPNAVDLQTVFTDLSVQTVKANEATATIGPLVSGGHYLYVYHPGKVIYYRQAGDQLAFTDTARAGYKLFSTSNGIGTATVRTKSNEKLRLTYASAGYNYANVLRNGSLESGSWQKSVGNCYNDGQPSNLGMALDSSDSTAGRQSIVLRAADHIACTGPAAVSVQAGQNYTLGFDFKNVGGNFAGFDIGFNDPQHSHIRRRLTGRNDVWLNFNQRLTVPAQATSLKLTVYAYSDPSHIQTGVAKYDDLSLLRIPKEIDAFYLSDKAVTQVSQPKLTYQVIDPTKTKLRLTGLKAPTYVVTKESYSSKWSLSPDDGTSHSWWKLAPTASIETTDHFKANGAFNAWYLDAAKLCNTSPLACHKNSDGSYDVALTMEYRPQRYFDVGLGTSVITAAAGLTYLGWSWRRKGKDFVYDMYGAYHGKR